MQNIRITDGLIGQVTRAAGMLAKYPSGFLKTSMPWGFVASNKPKTALLPDGRPVQLTSDEQAKAMLLGEKIYHSWRAGRFQFLQDNDGVSAETAEMKMEYWKFATTEPAFTASLWTKIISVISNEVIIQPASKDQRDKDMAEWVKECLHRTSGGLRKIGQEIFYHGLVRGNVLCEPKWIVKKSNRWAHLFPHGYWTLKDFVAKSPEDYRLEEDGFRNLRGVWSTRTNQWYPLSYFVHWANRPIYNNQAGTSEVRSIRRACTLLSLAHTFRGIYLEQFGLPILKGSYTRGDDVAYSLAYAALERARSLGFILMPDGSDVEALNIATRGQTDYGEAIEDYRKEIFLAVTGSYLFAMEGGVSNAAGNSETHRSTLDLSVWYLCKILEEILNEQIIPWMVSLNVYDAEPPIAQIGGVSDTDLKASMEIDTQLYNMEVPLDLDELYERYKRTPPKDMARAVKKAAATPPLSSPSGMGGMPSFADKKRTEQAQTTNYTCGSNAALHVLKCFGKAEGLSEATLAMEMGTTEEQGTSASALMRGLASHGLKAKGKLGMSLNELAIHVADDCVVVTSIQLKDSPEESKDANKEGHWVVVKEVDAENGTVSYYDPSLGSDRTVPAQEFSSDWHDIDASGRILSRFGIIVEDEGGTLSPTSVQMADGDDSPKEKKAWVGCSLAGKFADSFNKAAAMIDDEHVAGKGRVTDPHITLFYGCKDDQLEVVRSEISKMPPIKYTIGSLFTFSATKDGSVPLCAKVYSSGLTSLNEKLREMMPDVEQSYDSYQPHVTLAYMAPDMAKRYLSDRTFALALAGEGGLVEQAVFTASDNQKVEVPFASTALLLTGEKAASADTDGEVEKKKDSDVAGFSAAGAVGDDSVLAPSSKKAPKSLPTDEVAIAGADGTEVARLLKKAKQAGAQQMVEIVTPAIERYLKGKTWAISFLTIEEREALAESMADSITPADLVGRSRVWLRYRRDEEATAAEPTKFSDGTPYTATFADSLEPLKPEKAIDYFKSLAPKLGTDTGKYADEIRRKAFTMVEATEKTLLDKVKAIISKSLESGTPRGDIQISEVLERAGISPKNPQYCFLPGTKIEGDIIAMSRANYDGPAVKIKTADGRCLAVSINHPILTTQGWKVAGDIEQGDELVCYGNSVEPLTDKSSFTTARPPQRRAINNQDAPAAVEDVFESLLGQSGTILDSKRPVRPMDFHGDAAFMDGKIDRIRANWILRTQGVSAINQHRGKVVLMQRNIHASVSSSHSLSLLNVRGKRPFTSCPVHSAKHLGTNLITTDAPFSLAVIGASAKLNPSRFKALDKTPGGDVQLAGDLMKSLPSLVSTSRVTKVERFRWSGHVYDLQTKTGFIVSQGIVTSNCEMVYRTNMMDAFNTAQDEEMQRPVMQEAFPVWRYDGIDDERAGEDHKPHFGKYYPSTMSFGQVRGERVWNCRCSPRMLHKLEWEKLAAAGEVLDDGLTIEPR